MKKKCLSLIMIFILILGSVQVYGSQSEANTSLSCYVEVLSDLNLLPDSLKSESNYKKQMERGEFASLVSRLCGLNTEDAENLQSIYVDVPVSDKYAADIDAVTKYGYMSGDGNGNFNPEDKISYNQVIKVFLSMLGYDKYASYKGGYPTGYLSVANELKINRGIDKKNDKIYASQVIELAYNMLHTEVMKSTGIANGELIDSNSDGQTFLAFFHKIYVTTGVVDAVNSLMKINAPTLGEKEIIIDGHRYKSLSDKPLNSYFGHMVDAYMNEDEKIIAVTEASYGSRTISLDFSDVTIDGATIEYSTPDKDIKVKMNADTDIVYNGKPRYISDWQSILSSDGKLELIYSDSDNSVDVVNITVAKNYVVKTIDYRLESIYDKYSSASLSFKDLSDYTIIDSFGNKMTFNELGTSDVLSVVQSEDKEITTVYYSNREAEGAIAEMNSSTGEYIIGNNAYKLARSYQLGKDKIDMRSQGIFLIDYFGNIAGFKEYSDSFKFGYVLGIKLEEGIEKSGGIKIFCDDGVARSFDFNKKIYLDGVTMNFDDAVRILKTEYRDKGFLVRYYLTNQKVKSIDTLRGDGKSAEDGLRSVFQGYDDNGNGVKTLMFNGYQNVLGSKVAITPATTIFFIPTNGSLDEEDYSIGGRSHFRNWQGYFINAYTDSEDSYISQVLVMYGGSGSNTITYETPYVIVESVSECITESGEEAYKIRGFSRDPYQKGKYIDVLFEDVEKIDKLVSVSDSTKKHTLGMGDVIKIGYDSLGKPVDVELYYEYIADELLSETEIGADLLKEERTMRVSVYSAKEGIAWLTRQSLDTAGVILGLDDVEVINIDKYDVFYVENVGNKQQLVYTSSASVKDYLNHGDSYSKVIICAAYNSPGIMIIR